MPIPLATRTKWIEENVKDGYERPIEVRPWMIDEVITPMDGYRVWPRGPRPCCPACARLVGKIRFTRRACWRPPHGGCDGLRGHKIVLIVIAVTRQEGKTTTLASIELSDLDLSGNFHSLYMAAAEGQSERVYDQKFVSPIESNPGLAGRLTVLTHKIENPSKNNSFIFVPTSAKSIAAGTYRRITVDEARDVDGEVFIKLAPSVISAKGFECRYGHYSTAMRDDPPEEGGPYPPCPVCGTELEEWHGVVLVMSSAGLETGWFSELGDYLRENPNPGAHLFESAARLNSNKSAEAVEVMTTVFGALPSMQGLVDREFRNVKARKGDEFLTKAEVDAVVVKALSNLQTSSAAALGFLDCSLTGDLTALVLVIDVPVVDEKATAEEAERASRERREPKTIYAPTFTKIRIARIDVWDPQDKHQCPDGRVDYESIRQHLEDLVPRFPGLLELQIDTTRWEEARGLFKWCRKQRWGSRFREYVGNAHESHLMWQLLQERILAGAESIEIPDHARLKDELRRAAIRTNDRGIQKVMDTSKGNRRGGARAHRDVSMSLAGCCLMAAAYLVRGASSGVVAKINRSLSLNSRFRPLTSGIYKADS